MPLLKNDLCRRTLLPVFLLFGGIIITATAQDAPSPTLPGTNPWQMPADPAAEMVEGIHRHFDTMLADSVKVRDEAWKRGETDERFRRDRRERLAKSLGFVGQSGRNNPFENFVATDHFPTRSECKKPRNWTKHVRIDPVRWQVYPDYWMEGVLVQRNLKEGMTERERLRFVGVVLDNPTPGEEFGPHIDLAVRLAEAGGLILVPDLLDRSDRWSGDDKVRYTNLSHREWIWRMAWETGQTPLAYEVSGVIQGFRHLIQVMGTQSYDLKGSFVFGHGDGGQIALLASALHQQPTITWVSGYFQSRDTTQWLEPIDRTIWRQALEFQDAELAAMAAENRGFDRSLIIDRTDGPTSPVSLPPRNGRDDAADGALRPAKKDEIDKELARARKLAGEKSSNIIDVADHEAAIAELSRILGVPIPPRVASDKLQGLPPITKMSEAIERSVERLALRNNFQTWSNFTQSLLRTSELRRFEFWKAANPQKPEDFAKETDRLRKIFWEEQMGKMPAPTEPLEAETKLVYDEPNFRGYAVKLPMYPDVYAYGVLLLPKDLKPGEKRPVVVCQHGLEGRPDDIVDPSKKTVYHAYGAALADRGYIVFAPQNPYIGHERFRTIQRKAWPLGQSLFAVIIRQHERILDWLETQENVDPERIAFYGLSYGGKSAMRIPAVLTRYCMSICSADFNEWVVKCTNTDRAYSYMFTVEYDMYEWDLASRFNYAEMAALIAPRPFMVERGHFDGVAPDEWIGYEFAKVKRTYDLLGVGDKARIAYFNRGHEIDGTATFEFLAEHLKWPRGAAPLERPK